MKKRSGWTSKPLRWPGRLAVLTAAALLSGCAVLAWTPDRIPELAGADTPVVADVDLLAMTPAMADFVAEHVQASDSAGRRAWALTHAALDPYLLSFDYDPGLTLTAAQAFEQQQGNCLSFSALFVAMARDAGLNARFQEVELPPKWSAVNDTLLVNKHVNAVVIERGGSFVIDVSRRRPKANDRTRSLSDSEALAQYFNNLGAGALVEEELPRAYAYFRKALEIEPGLDYVWSNLGVVFRRNGQDDDAIAAYQTALRLNPDHAVSLNNLHTLYTEDGRLEEAQLLARRVERNRRNNPYYLLHLAELAQMERRWPDSIDLLQRAIRMEPGEYRFHYALAVSQQHSGQPERARDSLEKARELAPLVPLPDLADSGS